MYGAAGVNTSLARGRLCQNIICCAKTPHHNNALITGPKSATTCFALMAMRRRGRNACCRDFALRTPRPSHPRMSLKGSATIAPELGEQACVLRVLKPARAPIMASLARRRVHLGLIAKLIERSPVVAAGLLPRATARRRASL